MRGLCFLIIIGVVCWNVSVFAGDPMAFDAARATANLPSEQAGRTEQLEAQKMKNDQNDEQNQSYSESCGVKLPELTTAYAFMNAEYFEKADASKYNAPQKTKESALDFVKSTYFYEPGEEPLTPEAEQKIMDTRQAYNEEFQEHMRSLAAGVLEKLADDKKKAAEMSAETCGILEDIAVDSTVVQALIRQTIAEIGFQIALLERSVVDTLQTEPVLVLSKPDPLPEQEEPETPAPKEAEPDAEGPQIMPGRLAIVP